MINEEAEGCRGLIFSIGGINFQHFLYAQIEMAGTALTYIINQNSRILLRNLSRVDCCPLPHVIRFASILIGFIYSFPQYFNVLKIFSLDIRSCSH
jgi:hypothetical protein